MKQDAGRLLRKSVFPFALVATACVVAVATVAVAAGEGSDSKQAIGFLNGVVKEIASNDYRAAWLTLHPAQQRLLPQAKYVGCESASPIPGRLVSLTVVRAFEEPVVVAAANPFTVGAQAVTFRMVIHDAGLHESVSVQHTVHAIETGGRWAWILPAARLRLDRSPTCGVTSPTVTR